MNLGELCWFLHFDIDLLIYPRNLQYGNKLTTRVPPQIQPRGIIKPRVMSLCHRSHSLWLCRHVSSDFILPQISLAMVLSPRFQSCAHILGFEAYFLLFNL